MPMTIDSNIAPVRGHFPGWVKPGVLCIGLFLALSWSQGARASYWKRIPEGDFKYLPEYCKLAVGFYRGGYGGATPEELAVPLGAFSKRAGCGGDFHHYCAGLWHLHTTQLSNPWLPRDHLLGEAVGEFQYTIDGCMRRNPNANASILPEVFTNQGRAYVGLKKYSDAVRVFTEAIRRNPKYVDAYVELSGVFVLLNNTEDARKILEDGLKQSPGSKVLKARLNRLVRKDEIPAEAVPPEQEPKPQKAKP